MGVFHTRNSHAILRSNTTLPENEWTIFRYPKNDRKTTSNGGDRWRELEIQTRKFFALYFPNENLHIIREDIGIRQEYTCIQIKPTELFLSAFVKLLCFYFLAEHVAQSLGKQRVGNFSRESEFASILLQKWIGTPIRSGVPDCLLNSLQEFYTRMKCRSLRHS